MRLRDEWQRQFGCLPDPNHPETLPVCSVTSEREVMVRPPATTPERCDQCGCTVYLTDEDREFRAMFRQGGMPILTLCSDRCSAENLAAARRSERIRGILYIPATSQPVHGYN